MVIFKEVQQWLLRVALKKAIARGVQALAAIIAANALSGFGLSIDSGLLAVGIMIKLEFLRNWLKIKKGFSWIP